MKLSEFLGLKRLSDEEFGIAIGVSRATISRLRRGKMLPSIRLAGSIASVTNGAVTANDFLSSPDVPRPTPPARTEAETPSVVRDGVAIVPTAEPSVGTPLPPEVLAGIRNRAAGREA